MHNMTPLNEWKLSDFILVGKLEEFTGEISVTQSEQKSVTYCFENGLLKSISVSLGENLCK